MAITSNCTCFGVHPNGDNSGHAPDCECGKLNIPKELVKQDVNLRQCMIDYLKTCDNNYKDETYETYQDTAFDMLNGFLDYIGIKEIDYKEI